MPYSGSRPPSRSGPARSALGAFLSGLLLVSAAFVPAAFATPIVSAGNAPFAAISPGGVSMATGEIIIVCRPDLILSGPLPVAFGRYYASLLAREGLASGPLGPNWLGTYDWSLTINAAGARVATNRGASIQFTQLPAGGWALASPTYAAFRLDPAGAGWRFTNPIDRRAYFFDASLQLTQILDEHGNMLTLTRSAGRLVQVSDNFGRAIGFTYDAATGRLTQASDGTRTVHYGYTGGVLTTFTDAATHVWTYGYQDPPEPGAPALLTHVMEPLGNTPISQTFDPLGRVASQMDAAGSAVTYQYDTPTGNTFLDPLQSSWTYQHDALNRLTTLTDPGSGSLTLTYDASGRIFTASRPTLPLVSITYDPASGYPSVINLADGSQELLTYGSHVASGATFFDLATLRLPDGASEIYGRNASGDITDLHDAAGFHWLASYNGRGQMATVTNPTQGTNTFSYDPLGRLQSIQDQAGNTTNYAYDALSRLNQVSLAGGAARSYEYDALDHVTRIVDEMTQPWAYAYDADGRLSTATDPLIHVTGYSYDGLDRLTQVQDPLGHAEIYGYDPKGRLASITDRSGRAVQLGYDTRNRMTSIADPSGSALFGYDSDGRMTSAQDPLGNSSAYQYDAMDRLIHLTDPVTSGFDYAYDPMARLRSANGPLGFHLAFEYDGRGLPTSITDGTSQTLIGYNPLGLISQITDPNHNAWPRQYDPLGRLTTASDPLGRSFGYQYDARNRPNQVLRPDGSTATIQYDAAGRPIQIQGPFDGNAANTTVSYGYDAAGRLTSASGASFTYDEAGRMIVSNGFPFVYDFEGRVLGETLAPGKTVTYSYDNRGLPSQVMDWNGGTTSFNFDAAHRLSTIGRPDGTTATYQYDAVGRLTSAVEKNPGPTQTPISSITIGRDALGRPMSIDRRQPLMPGATSTGNASLAYDAASQLTSVSHDAYGRTTGDASRVFHWDGLSRLDHYAAGIDSPRIAYDAFGQQLTSSLGAQTVQRAWTYARGTPDVDDMMVSLPSRFRLLVRAPSGLLLYGVDGPSGARSFYHYDEAGNTAYLTNDSGSVTTEYAYKPFGGVTSLGQTTDNPFTFGAADGMMSLGSSGAWAEPGGGVYDERTMRDIAGIATSSGPALFAKSPGPPQVPALFAKAPGPPQFAWKAPGPPGFGWKSPGPAGSGWKDPGPPGFGWRNPGPGGFDWRNPGPPNFGWKQPGPPGFGSKDPGPIGFDWRNPGPQGFGWKNPGPSGTGWKNPGPIGVDPVSAFFRSVGGLGMETEVVDYAEGGVTTGVLTRPPWGGPKYFTLVDPYMIYRSTAFAGSGSPIVVNVVPVKNGGKTKVFGVEDYTSYGPTVSTGLAAPCAWCVAPYDVGSGDPTNDVNDVNR